MKTYPDRPILASSAVTVIEMRENEIAFAIPKPALVARLQKNQIARDAAKDFESQFLNESSIRLPNILPSHHARLSSIRNKRNGSRWKPYLLNQSYSFHPQKQTVLPAPRPK